MTEAQCTDSSQRSRSSARQLLSNSEHDALVEAATMSSYGLSEFPSIISGLNQQFTIPRNKASHPGIRHAQTQTSEPLLLSSPADDHRDPLDAAFDEQRSKKVRTTFQRIQFGEFAEQLRQQQYFENRKSLLRQRIKVLQKTITLSARLHRVGLWVGDGLVEISAQSDTIGFARVHQHFQNLTDLSYSQWDRELHAIDPLSRSQISNLEAAGSLNSISKLPGTIQTDLLELVTYLRSNPRFLAERFKLLAPSQIVSLWNVPRPQQHPNSADTQYPRGSRDQLNRFFSKSLEDYAASFERSNPLSFLLFNIYGTDQSSVHAENQLRLSTWSQVCAELMLTSNQAYQSLIFQLLDHFASLYEWRARDSVEFFLMGILQRGSFLLDPSDSPTTRRSVSYNLSTTSEAREFFDAAVRDLFELLVDCDGGFPLGALQLAAAILDKIPAARQAEFRGTFFFSWFIQRFLRVVINYPENENMLLKFHISGGARKRILHKLYRAMHERVQNVMSQMPDQLIDPELHAHISEMVGWVDSAKSTDPYKEPVNVLTQQGEQSEASITISVSEIVQVLEAIAPQKIHDVMSHDQLLKTPIAFSTFHGQYTYATHRFDRLKNVLISSSEPGSSATIVHPCQEQWLQITIDPAGKPKLPRNLLRDTDNLQTIELNTSDSAQQGALRLFKDHISESALIDSTSYRNDLLKSHSLTTMFREMAAYTSAKHDPVGCNYWNDALDVLHSKYPLSILVPDDSAVLRTMFEASKDAQITCREQCSKLEVQLSIMEDICLKIRSSIDKSIDGFESLRLKLWYSTDVVGSKAYENAKYVARALNNMAMPTSTSTGNHHSSSISSFLTGRPMSPRSVASSTIEQPYKETMNAMKASVEQGGPRKLSDRQIELTNNWLTQTHIEKFCEGEERIHRFCMEIHNVAKNLVGETLSLSPVLWASGLFAREQSLYNTNSFGSASAPASTRPASISSSSFGYVPSSSVRRSTESLRMVLEDRKPGGPAGNRRDVLPPELAASIRSLSRAHSATTAGSISSVFSPLPSNSRSLTSASVYSKSPSLFNDSGLSRFEDTTREKAKFLDRVQQALVCLLLSDLGCPVWTMGSETDAMLTTFRETSVVSARLKQRMLADSLADRARCGWLSRSQQQSSGVRPRSQSMSAKVASLESIATEAVRQHSGHGLSHLEDDHQADLRKLLTKLGQQVDPMEKIAIVKEFYELSLSTLWCRSPPVNTTADNPNTVVGNLRRSSLDEHVSRSRPGERNEVVLHTTLKKQDINSYSEHEIIQHIKSDLAKLCPTTLFRDLQYISAFVSTEYIDNGSQGKALTHVGLAAFAYKDEVCRSMVDVADKIFSQIRDPRSQPESMQQVASLWMFAAREGNAVAQRELALLYLSQPHLLPITSLPLSQPSQIFRTDMSWHERHQPNTDIALCLALHWLKEASKKGDRLAKRKLDERARAISIR